MLTNEYDGVAPLTVEGLELETLPVHLRINGLGSPPAPVVALAFSFGGVFGAAMLFTGGAVAVATGAVLLGGGEAGVGFAGEAAFGILGVPCVAEALGAHLLYAFVSRLQHGLGHHHFC